MLFLHFSIGSSILFYIIVRARFVYALHIMPNLGRAHFHFCYTMHTAQCLPRTVCIFYSADSKPFTPPEWCKSNQKFSIQVKYNDLRTMLKEGIFLFSICSAGRFLFTDTVTWIWQGERFTTEQVLGFGNPTALKIIISAISTCFVFPQISGNCDVYCLEIRASF